MPKNRFKITLGSHEFNGFSAALIGGMILIPAILLIFFLLLFVFRFIGVLLGGTLGFVGGIFSFAWGIVSLILTLLKVLFSFIFGIIGIALILIILALILPSNTRKRLTSHLHFKRSPDVSSKTDSSNTTSTPNSPIIDVAFEEVKPNDYESKQ